MKALFFLPLMFIGVMMSAQINPDTVSRKYSDPQNMDVVYSSEARYQGEEAEMYSTIYKSINYSAEAKNASIDDNVMLSFDVNFDGRLQDFTLIHGVGYGIDEQIIEAIKKMTFSPAVMNGIEVRQNVMLTIPIKTWPDM